jgi:hypothetical protein
MGTPLLPSEDWGSQERHFLVPLQLVRGGSGRPGSGAATSDRSIVRRDRVYCREEFDLTAVLGKQPHTRTEAKFPTENETLTSSGDVQIWNVTGLGSSTLWRPKPYTLPYTLIVIIAPQRAPLSPRTATTTTTTAQIPPTLPSQTASASYTTSAMDRHKCFDTTVKQLGG